MVQSTITDGDAGDMLTWSVMSDMEMYATATVDDMGMVTVTGVAPGTATITVTAMDMGVGGDAMMNRMSDSQSFMVTVESAITELTAPTNVMATDESESPGNLVIGVTWTDGMNAMQHIVLLFDSDFALAMPVQAGQTDGMTMFQNVEPGMYTVVVVAVESTSHYLYAYDTITVGQ